jgi:hypothetical protein
VSHLPLLHPPSPGSTYRRPPQRSLYSHQSHFYSIMPVRPRCSWQIPRNSHIHLIRHTSRNRSQIFRQDINKVAASTLSPVPHTTPHPLLAQLRAGSSSPAHILRPCPSPRPHGFVHAPSGVIPSLNNGKTFPHSSPVPHSLQPAGEQAQPYSYQLLAPRRGPPLPDRQCCDILVSRRTEFNPSILDACACARYHGHEYEGWLGRDRDDRVSSGDGDCDGRESH